MLFPTSGRLPVGQRHQSMAGVKKSHNIRFIYHSLPHPPGQTFVVGNKIVDLSCTHSLIFRPGLLLLRPPADYCLEIGYREVE